ESFISQHPPDIHNDPLEGTTHDQHLIAVYVAVTCLICLAGLLIIIFSLKRCNTYKGVPTTGATGDETQANITSTG
ncbi:hypothetical protein scyTo_0021493, partial [Scyliorhinus torazame]|nr:hypothetical protein [Scyliorhinus torazame]